MFFQILAVAVPTLLLLGGMVNYFVHKDEVTIEGFSIVFALPLWLVWKMLEGSFKMVKVVI